MIRLFGATCVTVLAFLTSSVFGEELRIAEGYSDFGSPGPVTVDRPMQLVVDQIVAFPERFGGGRPELELKSYMNSENLLVVEIIENGFLDDSVKGANKRFVFSEAENGKFKLTEYGYRQQCYRGNDPTKWVAQPCS